MTQIFKKSEEYGDWLIQLKTRFRQTQLKAAVSVNQDLLKFYWDLGVDIIERQKSAEWGSGFLKQLSKDLKEGFPDLKGFSYRNLKYIRQWVLFYSAHLQEGQQAVAQLKLDAESEKSQQPVGLFGQDATTHIEDTYLPQITAIPWGHNLVIISKSESVEEALYYVQHTIEYGWSRSVLTHQIENELWKREGEALNNFDSLLCPIDSDLAKQTLKDPYVFDFLNLTKRHNERELENALVDHITQFLLELGAGFAYIGRQIPIQVGKRDFFLDLLFYHTQLHCYVVVELKVVDFEPEHAGKLNFYLKAVDEQMRCPEDGPSIGILICKNRDRTVVEYALSDVNKPIGVSEYQLRTALPKSLKSSFPSIEELEAELASKEVT